MTMFDRLKLAMGQDPRIVVAAADLPQVDGFTLDYLEQLGLEKRDLKKLERMGLAVRGRMPTKEGHRVRWVIVKEILGAK